MTEPIRIPVLARGVRWSDVSAELLGRIDAVIEDLDPADPDTPVVVAELRAAAEVPVSDEELRRVQAGVNRMQANLAAVAERQAPLFRYGLHPDGWGPCPEGCPCSACDVSEPVIEVVAETPHTRGWLNRWARTLKRGTK